MTLRILSAVDDDAEWASVMALMPYDLRDVKMTPEWCLLEANLPEGETAHLAVFTGPTYTIAQAFIRRPWGGWCDIKTIHGPVSSATVHSVDHGEAFGTAWTEWMEGNAVLAEFCLLNPLYEAQQGHIIRKWDDDMVRERSVVLKKVAPFDELLIGMAESQRQDVLWAKANGYGAAVVPPGEASALFAAMYDDAMRRKEAAPRWRLNESYFAAVAGTLGPRAQFVFITDGEHVRAAALFLLGSACAYYHLAASGGLRARGASALAIVHGLELARQHGCAWMHLGGGVTSSPNDSLLAFKTRLGDLVLPAFSYRRIIDPFAYDDMVRLSGGPPSNYFPAYRWKEAQS